jgi:DivIVA domain-containing protein
VHHDVDDAAKQESSVGSRADGLDQAPALMPPTGLAHTRPTESLPQRMSFATMSPMPQPSLEPPTPPQLLRFTRVRFREGYNIEDVDDFLRRAHHALESRDGSITASDVHASRFRPVRIKECYAMGEVDEELDRIAGALERIEGEAGA